MAGPGKIRICLLGEILVGGWVPKAFEADKIGGGVRVTCLIKVEAGWGGFDTLLISVTIIINVCSFDGEVGGVSDTCGV